MQSFQQSAEHCQKIIDSLIEKSGDFEELFSGYTDRFRANVAYKKAQYQYHIQNLKNIEDMRPLETPCYLYQNAILP